MTPDMGHAEDFHAFVFHDVKDLVGKTAREDAARVLVKHGVMERMRSDGAKCSVDFAEKLVTEAGTAFLIPVKCLRQVGFSFGTDDERKVHFRREVMRA